jgi:glycine cleavage system H protein
VVPDFALFAQRRGPERELAPPYNVQAMPDVPKELLYTEDHEYVKSTDDENVVIIGITDYAQGELGDIVFIELPTVGSNFGKHDVFGTVEAVKAVSELYSPLSGQVVDVNGRLDKEPALVNSAPYGDGWMIKLRLKAGDERDELLGSEEYSKLIG